MAKPTEQVTLTGKKSLGQTMLQGAKVLGGKEVPNYTLLFLDPTKNKKKGDYQTIVIPYVEIGRHGNCVVQYGDEHNAIHRKHAAILWDKGEVVIKHLGTNPLLVNGQQIATGGQKILQNADEIQLSQNGPRIRFNATATKTSTMGVTQRMGLVLDQALKPYKTAVMGLSALLLSLVAFSGYQYFDFQRQVEQFEEREQAYLDRTKLQDEELYRLDLQKDSVDQLLLGINSRNQNTDRKINQLVREKERLEQLITGLTQPSVKDTDRDGYPDSIDRCPNEAGPDNGCPKPVEKDTDGDGFPDLIDNCPEEAGGDRGCPKIEEPKDTDDDGVPDLDDKCPNTPGRSKDGCPIEVPDKMEVLVDKIFADGKVTMRDFSSVKQLFELTREYDIDTKVIADLISESTGAGPLSGKTLGLLADVFEDERLGLGDIPEVVEMLGVLYEEVIQDPDGDGIKGKDDKCPKEAGPKSNDGCPEPDKTKDSDGDGVPDSEDKCPNEAGSAENSGCIIGGGGDANDKDGDGTPDNIDNCPEVKGLSTNNGCPPAPVDPDKDSDGDGIIDSQDECPCVSGKKKRQGCPKGAKGNDHNQDCI